MEFIQTSTHTPKHECVLPDKSRITAIELGGVLVIGGSASYDPTTGDGLPAPVGSLYLRGDGTMFLKTTSPDTGWTEK